MFALDQLQTFYILRATRALRAVSVGCMAMVAVILLVGGVFPEVKDPWPSSIGLDLPFTVAGAFGVLASARNSEKSDAERSREINLAGVVGFRLGIGLYVLSLLNQLTFGL